MAPGVGNSGHPVNFLWALRRDQHDGHAQYVFRDHGGLGNTLVGTNFFGRVGRVEYDGSGNAFLDQKRRRANTGETIPFGASAGRPIRRDRESLFGFQRGSKHCECCIPFGFMAGVANGDDFKIFLGRRRRRATLAAFAILIREFRGAANRRPMKFS